MALLIKGLIWIQAAFYLFGFLIGLPYALWLDYRVRRAGPTPEQVRAFADQLEALYGEEAYALAGNAVAAARFAKDFPRHRFLKQVALELVARRHDAGKNDCIAPPSIPEEQSLPVAARTTWRSCERAGSCRSASRKPDRLPAALPDR